MEETKARLTQSTSLGGTLSGCRAWWLTGSHAVPCPESQDYGSRKWGLKRKLYVCITDLNAILLTGV